MFDLLCSTGVGLDLGAELYCLTCEEGLQHAASMDSSQVESSNISGRSISGASDGKRRRSVGKTDGDVQTAKLYSCSLCAFTSRYSNHLKRHMRIHDGQKPYRCPVCPYASAQLVNLQRHGRTHTGEKPYRCHQCSYACSSLGNLRRHQRMHAQERPQRRGKEKRRGRRKKGSAETQEGKTTSFGLVGARNCRFMQNQTERFAERDRNVSHPPRELCSIFCRLDAVSRKEEASKTEKMRKRNSLGSTARCPRSHLCCAAPSFF